MAMLVKAAYFIVLLGGLVFFHELGHFLVAKLFHVKVLKFSLGFGPRIWGVTRGETEYQIAALPLGGYVKMLNEEDPNVPTAPEDKGRGYADQKPYKRALISLAGPALNLLLPPLVYCGMNLVPHLEDPPVVAIVLPNEPAERAGVEPRDRVISVDGVQTRSFEEMREAIEARASRPIDLVVNRHGEQKVIHVTPTSETEKNLVETTRRGKIGIMGGKLPSYVGVVPGSRASEGGVQTFDRVVAVNGKSVSSRVDLDDEVKAAGEHAALKLDVIRSTTIDLKTTSIATAKPVTLQVLAGQGALGLEAPDLYLREVDPSSNAYVAGLRPLDKVVAVAGTPVYSVMRLPALLDDKKVIALQVDRAGQRVDVMFEPLKTMRDDPMLGPTPETEFGFRFHRGMFNAEPYPPSEQVMISYPPMMALSRGVEQTATITREMVLGIAAMFQGRISTKALGGPIMMFQLASAKSEEGIAAFLDLFAKISINLGLMNLLPVPVLDGFNILLATVEGISRRVVPVRVRELATMVGAAMVIALMLLAFKNDVFRVLGL